MLVVPLVVGVWMGGPVWVHAPLAVTWFVGYFAFFAAGLWVKSHFKARYVPPLRAYALAAVPCGVVTLWLAPRLAWWALAYVPLLSVSVWCSYRRRDRSLLNDGVMVLAGCLMLPVAFHASRISGAALAADWSRAWVAFVLVAAYFVGTIVYVKTMIRERGSRAYVRASVGYHFTTIVVPLALYLAVPAAGVGAAGMIVLSAFFVLCAARAVVMPQRGGTPRQVGVMEIVLSTILAILLVVCV